MARPDYRNSCHTARQPCEPTVLAAMRVNNVRSKNPNKRNQSRERQGVPASPHTHSLERDASLRCLFADQTIGLARDEDTVPPFTEGFRLKEYAFLLAAQTRRGLSMKNVKWFHALDASPKERRSA